MTLDALDTDRRRVTLSPILSTVASTVAAFLRRPVDSASVAVFAWATGDSFLDFPLGSAWVVFELDCASVVWAGDCFFAFPVDSAWVASAWFAVAWVGESFFAFPLDWAWVASCLVEFSFLDFPLEALLALWAFEPVVVLSGAMEPVLAAFFFLVTATGLATFRVTCVDFLDLDAEEGSTAVFAGWVWKWT